MGPWFQTGRHEQAYYFRLTILDFCRQRCHLSPPGVRGTIRTAPEIMVLKTGIAVSEWLCRSSVYTPLTAAGCVTVGDPPLSHRSRSHRGACHQPCMSLPAVSQCVGADGMAASQAQLRCQICFLSVMPNYGEESNAVYMLSLLGQSLDEKCHTPSLSLLHRHLMRRLYLLMIHIGMWLYAVVQCVITPAAGTPHRRTARPDEMKYIPIMICRWGCCPQKSFRKG